MIVLTGSALALAVLAASVAAQVDEAGVYASVGAELTQYSIDVDHATLTKGRTATLPANVQEAAWHPSAPYGVTAFRIDAASAPLTPHGSVAPLRTRCVGRHTPRSVGGAWGQRSVPLVA